MTNEAGLSGGQDQGGGMDKQAGQQGQGQSKGPAGGQENLDESLSVQGSAEERGEQPSYGRSAGYDEAEAMEGANQGHMGPAGDAAEGERGAAKPSDEQGSKG